MMSLLECDLVVDITNDIMAILMCVLRNDLFQFFSENAFDHNVMM